MIFLDYNSISSNKSEEEKELEELLKTCRLAAMKYVAGRHRSTGQLRRKLAESEQAFSDDIIEMTISSVEKDGYLSDQELANSILQERRGRKAESKLALRMRLERFGIKPPIIYAVLEDHVADQTLLSEFLEEKQYKLINEYQNTDDFEARNKLLAKIMRSAGSRGFAEHLVFSYIRDIQ